jgi:type IV pilus assembly protein PilA
MGMGGNEVRREESGFSLIELLVVIAIIAILAAIAVPIFLSQREKAYETSMQSTLKDASTAVEARAVEDLGTFAALDEQSASVLEDEGFKMPEWSAAPGYVSIEANATRYCIQAQHKELAPTNVWRRSTYDSSVGKPQANPDVCPEL